MLDATLCMKITDASSKCIMLINVTRFADTKMISLSLFQHGKMKLQEAKNISQQKTNSVLKSVSSAFHSHLLNCFLLSLCCCQEQRSYLMTA